MNILILNGSPSLQGEPAKMVSTFKAVVIVIYAVMMVILSGGCSSPAQSVSDPGENDVPTEMSESALATSLQEDEPQERAAEASRRSGGNGYGELSAPVY